MKVLIVGSGGREHALGYKIKQSEKVTKIYFAPGNGGTCAIGENIPIEVSDIPALKNFALENNIDIAVIGPELPLSLGIVDEFRGAGIKVFGPDKAGAALEYSKAFSKDFMKKYDIPTAEYQSFNDYNLALNYLKTAKMPLVIKADGLAAGKGVIICTTLEEANTAVKEIMSDKIFGNQSVVIEEFLTGKEVSLICFTDSETIVPMESASDYKRAWDNDEGPNTGGMGSISPSPHYAKGIADDIVYKTLKGIQSEGFDFRGVIYIGLMLTSEGPKVLEYNVRFGDPETEALILRLDSDLIEIIEHVVNKTLNEADIRWKKQSSVTVVIAAEGYPQKPITGSEINILSKGETVIFHCGTKQENDKLISSGGRVLAVSALGENLGEAREKCYNDIQKINFPQSFYRKDIGVF